MKKYILVNLFALTLVIGSCQENSNRSVRPYQQNTFKQYWYSGKAEISSYTLDQSRYGQQRKGKAVLIFVTEDFSKKKQVKLDEPSSAEADKIGVLKLNFVKNFVTGIYP